MLLDEIKDIKSGKPELKKFGFTIGIVVLIISAAMFYYKTGPQLYFAAAGAVLMFAGFAFPVLLKPLQKVWMTLALILGFIMSRVILTVLFYLIITPIGLAAKLAGKDFLELKIEKPKKSYWNFRDKKEYEKLDTERQF